MAETVEEIDTTFHINVKLLQSDYKTEFFILLNVCLSIIIIIVNFLVVLSTGFIIKKGQQPRATYIYLGNISLSDMIVGIVTVFIDVNPHQFHSEILCSISLSLAITATLSSVFSIGLIAIDRYLYILHGLHYHRYITTQHSPCMVSLVWLGSAILGFVPLLILRRPMEEKTCWVIILVPAKIVVLLVFTGSFQMILIIVLYSIILKNALNSISRIHCTSVSNVETQARNMRITRSPMQFTSNSEIDDHLPSNRARSFSLPCCQRNSITFAIRPTPTFCENKWKAVKIVVFTAGAFFVTWFPNIVTWIFYAYNCDESTDNRYCEQMAYKLSNLLSLLSLSNSLLNPIIYAWWHQGFRKSVKKMYWKLLGKRYKKPSSGSPCPPEPKIHQSFSLKQIPEENLENLK